MPFPAQEQLEVEYQLESTYIECLLKLQTFFQ